MEQKSTKAGDLHKGHRQRVWKELIKTGIDENTPPHKVLELMLFFTIQRKDTNVLAHVVLDHFGNSFSRLMDASVEELMEASKTDLKNVPKITEYTASHLKLILEFAKFYYSAKVKEEKRIFSIVESNDFLAKKLYGVRVESAYVLCLDNANRFLACPKIAEGSELTVALSSKKLVEKITQTGATRVILAHNHPRGTSLPSNADLQVTQQIKNTLLVMGIELMDHIIVSDNDYVSLRSSAKYNFLFN